MKLFYSPGACALASQIILREVGVKFELSRVDIKAKTYSGGDYRALNPKGYIPALQTDDGELLTEGAVILQWIADQSPEKNLIPKWGTKERYRAMEWLNFISTELHKGLGALFGAGLNDEAKTAIVARVHARLAYVNEHLKKNAYILGAQFSVADAYLFNIVRWAAPLKVDISQHTAILGLMEKVGQRASAREAIDAEGLKA